MPEACVSTGRPAASAAMEGRRLLRLDADDANLACEPCGEAADQPAAADRDQQRVERRILLQLHADRALAEHRLGLVERMHRHRAGLGDIGVARRQRVGDMLACDFQPRAIVADAFGLRRRGDAGQEDRCRYAEPLRGIGDCRAMIAAGRRGDSGRGHLAQQQVGKRAAHLEGTGMLQHLQLECDGRGRQPEIGEVGGKTWRAAEIGPDHGFRRRNGLARDGSLG